MTTDTDTRLDQLEIDLAHANRTIEELNGVVIAQGKQIDRMSRLLSNMTDQVEELVGKRLSRASGRKTAALLTARP